MIDREIEGFPAVVFQHEVDHLNGIVFMDRMPNLSTLAYQREYDKFWLPQHDVQD
jgi:peptide deformylase